MNRRMSPFFTASTIVPASERTALWAHPVIRSRPVPGRGAGGVDACACLMTAEKSFSPFGPAGMCGTLGQPTGPVV
ncbi:hypothetical protein DSECCO2_363720 [anaerobic digester metagenome]